MQAIMAYVTCFGGNYAPQGWALCNGQLLSIQVNSALYSLLGNVYGGDGVSTFALPNLCGRTPVSAGTGPGLSEYALGQLVGQETITLTVQNMPSHNHNGTVNLQWAADSS